MGAWVSILRILGPVLLRPMAQLLAFVGGVAFTKHELENILGGEPNLAPEDLEKQAATMGGLIVGILLGSWIISGGKGRKR